PNPVQVSVNWNGTTPNNVEFKINDQTKATENADQSGATHTFDMGNDFPPGNSTLSAIAHNQEGNTSAPKVVQICAAKLPDWLKAVPDKGSLNFALGPYSFKIGSQQLTLPAFKLDASVSIPSDASQNLKLSAKATVDQGEPVTLPFVNGVFGLAYGNSGSLEG